MVKFFFMFLLNIMCTLSLDTFLLHFTHKFNLNSEILINYLCFCALYISLLTYNRSNDIAHCLVQKLKRKSISTFSERVLIIPLKFASKYFVLRQKVIFAFVSFNKNASRW